MILKFQKSNKMNNETSTLRIQETDKPAFAITKMADKNYGAWEVLTRIFSQGGDIDPELRNNAMLPIKALDAFGIYGKAIYILYNDICYRDLPKTLAVIKAASLQLFSDDVLKVACSREDCSGRALVPVFDLYEKIRYRFPNFNNK